MKKHLQQMAVAILFLFTSKAQAQFNSADVKYWVGAGTDTSIFVVDFHDGSFWDTCYAWGYIHNAGATGIDMLNDIAAADANLDVNISGGFLNDITYGNHAGIGGTNGFYWSTWDGTAINNLVMNAGLSSGLFNGSIFACSFTDFNPAVAPGNPIAAFNPLAFTAQNIVYWVGFGTDTTLLVVDFHNATGVTSYAWGYLHNAGATAQDMLTDIDAADTDLSVTIGGGFLSDITYKTLAGIGGNPDYWSTWSATNLGNWDMNLGVSTVLGNGDLFGCSYTNFTPPLRPGFPAAASIPTAIPQHQSPLDVFVYPNPANHFLNINHNHFNSTRTTISITDVVGHVVYTNNFASNSVNVVVATWPVGIYTVKVANEKGVYFKRFVKQ